MKKIVLKVEVPDDYVLDNPSWLLENIGNPSWLMEDLNTSGFDVECI